ncbi:MAG TPA: 2-C-methyl-D-erythritol 4-phosphate cytidylyltransferase, partial [Thermomicrobiales bacterium]|nr:2-C-methyl-D-erythritol 4-phosphate cytidylyltransferase [Thermomicrobiales bacterium]
MSDPDSLESFASVVIVAAGRGERFGVASKVLALAGGRSLLGWSLRSATTSSVVRDVIVVAAEQSMSGIRAVVNAGCWKVPVKVVVGGSRRQDSVAAGVAAAPDGCDVILVHDAARPLATPEQFTSCALAALATGAAIVATPVADTLKRVEHDVVQSTVSRAGLWAAQTPQGFQRERLLSALHLTADQHVEYTDEASLMESLGHNVAIVPGSRLNLKVTHP